MPTTPNDVGAARRELDELQRLVAEQAALRRVATLVAQDAASDELFDAVAREVGMLFGGDYTGMIRYEADHSFVTTMATWAAVGEHPPVPARFRTVPGDPTAMVADTGKPVRLDDWASVPGPIAEVVRRELEVKASIGTPIVVKGSLWGALAVHSKRGPLPPDTESRLSSFTELVATAIANTDERAEVSRLAEEQAALRRVATLVARGARPEDLFTAVVEEVAGLLPVTSAAMGRFDPDGMVTTVAAWSAGGVAFPVGGRWDPEGNNVTGLVLSTGRPARLDDYHDASGPIGVHGRDAGYRSAVGSPITVEGRLWGVMSAASNEMEPLPADIEMRLASFTELVATAIANSESRSGVTRLAEVQAALRRVAEFVAREASQVEIFTAIAEEIGQLLGADKMRMMRYEDDAEAVVVASAGGSEIFSVGSRWPLEGDNVTARVFRTGLPARIDDYPAEGGRIAEGVRSIGLRGVVGTPILVEGRLWGAMLTATVNDEPLPPDTEARLGQFTELMATAIANAEARTEVERLADEQAALRRVATLVAEGAPPSAVFEAVAAEMSHVLGADGVTLGRYEPNDQVVVVAHAGAGPQRLPVGLRMGHRGENVTSLVRSSKRPARLEHREGEQGALAEIARDRGVRASVGAPVVVGGGLWGVAIANWRGGESPAADTEERMAKFAELVATAIANTEARTEVERLAQEQAALRRVATLVAEGARPAAVFDAVATELERVLGADGVSVNRYEPNDEVTVVAQSGADPWIAPPGTRLSIAEVVRNVRRRASVWAPIVVDGRVWGAAIANWRDGASPPDDTQERMASFAELLETGIANADSADQLTASRARLLTEADGARRRVVRDLHDGAQQRLVHTIVTLKLAQRALRASDQKAESLVSEALEQAQRGNAELRELAHGILPAVLTQGGLRSGVSTIVARLELPVEVDIPAERFPAEIEASAYFIVAEALMNVVKHSQANHAEVRACARDGMLRIEVRDNGLGGADPNGHGLVGLSDRVTALGGRLGVTDAPGGGTLLAASLPLSPS